MWTDDETPEEYERQRLQDMLEIVNQVNFRTLGQELIKWREACEKMLERLEYEMDEEVREDIDELVWQADDLSVNLNSLADFIDYKMRPIEKAAQAYDQKHDPDFFDEEKL